MEHRGSRRTMTPTARGRRPWSRLRRVGSLATAVALTASGLVVGAAVAPVAAAAPGPVQTPTSGMVTAQALPTVQINGVVWAQAIVGNTVYAGGSFLSARPAGSPRGTNEVGRANLLAYNLTTGELIPSFQPNVNAQVRAVAATPDGKFLYVGGDFTSVNSSSRSRIAKFNAETGELVTSFLGALDFHVDAIAATNDAVYVGGDFNNARGVPRKRLAAFSKDGALLGWNPGADGKVNALVMSPDNSKVVVGGAFGVLAGRASYGHGAVGKNSGLAMTWNANNIVRNYGAKAAITSLSTDGSAVYGSGYVYNGTGNLEGAFAADPANGTLKWVEDCHGDTYGTWAPKTSANVMYTVGHAHYCSNVGGPPESAPVAYNRAVAFTKSVTGTLTNNGDAAYANWSGNASPSMVNWFPLIAMGSFTGQNQGSWTITGNDQYVVVGGEFPRVNGVNQQGLVRFSVLGAQQPTNKSLKPLYGGKDLVPTMQSMAKGGVRATLTTNVDKDDSLLTYQLVRDGKTVSSATASSTYWSRPKVTIADSGLTAGKTYKYQVRTVDPGGNTTLGNPVSFTATQNSAPGSAYSQMVANQTASAYWRFGESGTIYDWAGANDGSFGSGVTRNQPGAIVGDPNTAAAFNGTPNALFSTKRSMGGPQIFSAEAWIKTTTTAGGKILGFGDSPIGSSGTYDRHIYMDKSGKLYFGAFVNGSKTVTSPKAYNDGKWHQVVGTLSRAGLVLYVDGVKVAQDSSVRSAQGYTGWWRVGGDSLAGWPGAVSSNYFKGTIDEVSIYPSALTPQQVADQYAASGQNAAAAAVAPLSVDGAQDPTSVEAAPAPAQPQNRIAVPNPIDPATDPAAPAPAVDPAADPAPVPEATVPAPVVTDLFERAVTSGLGSADQGGAWTVGEPAADYAVDSGAASITLGSAGAERSAFLDAVGQADATAAVDARLDKVADGDGSSVSLIARHTGTGDYRVVARVLADGSVTVQPVKQVGGVMTELAAATTVPGLTYVGGDTLRVRLQVSGTDTVTVAGTAWNVGTPEPTTPTVTGSDATAPLPSGGVGIAAALSGTSTGTPVVVSFDNLTVG